MASTDATPASTTTMGAEETVAWEHAKDLSFVRTDASLADQSEFQSSLENSTSSEPFNKSMMKSKAFGQSKPFEGDLLANIEESELDEMFAGGGKTQQNSSPSEKVSSSSLAKDNGQSQNDNSSSLQSNNSSMHATITSIQLDAPMSKELSTFILNAEDSDDTKFPSFSSTAVLATASNMESKRILSPQRQTSEELLQVLSNIETSYPQNNDCIEDNNTPKNNLPSHSEKLSNNNIESKKVTIKDEGESISTAEMENTSEKQHPFFENNPTSDKKNDHIKPLRRKSLGGKDKKEEVSNKSSVPTTKPSYQLNANSKQIISSEAAASHKSPLTVKKMVDAAEAVALKSMKGRAVAATSKTSNVDNIKKSHVSIVSSAIEKDTEPVETQNTHESQRKDSSSSKLHKASLSHLQKRLTPRRKEETPNSADSNAIVYGSEIDDDASSLTSDNLNSKSKSSIAKRKNFLPDINKENANVSPMKSSVLSKKKELMQQYTRKAPPKDPSRIKLPSIAPKVDTDGAVEDGNNSFVSQETPGRAARSVVGGINSGNNNTRAAYSSPPFDRNTNNNSNIEANVNSVNISPKKRRKPLFLRMIAKADKMLREEERKKQENYNRLRALRPKNTPSRAELKQHAHKFEEFIKSKAELSRQNHIAQIRALKEQHRQQHQKQKDDDGNSVASLAGDTALEETSLDRESIDQDSTPVKGAAKAKLQKELERFDHITQVLEEQKKERNRQYKGLLKKAGLTPASGDVTGDNNSPDNKAHHKHAFEVTPPKKPKVKATVSMHVVTIGNDAEIILSPRNNMHSHNIVSNDAIDNALYPHLEPHHDQHHHTHASSQPHFSMNSSIRQSTPHREPMMDDEQDDKNNDDQNNSNNLPSFALVDVLDDEAMQVLNHHRHAGETGNNENGKGEDDVEEGEERMEAISLADYIPALNEQPLPETVKIQEGFFDDVLSSHNTQGFDNDDILKVITTDDDFDYEENIVSGKVNRSLTAVTVTLEESLAVGLHSHASLALSHDPTVEDLHPGTDMAAANVIKDDVKIAVEDKGKEDVEEVVNVPDLSEKEVAYFVANDWIDMLANTSMMSDENGC